MNKNYIITLLSGLVCIICVVNFVFTRYYGKKPIVYETQSDSSACVGTSDDDSYFDTARYNRKQSRDEAISVLKNIVNDETYDEDTRQKAGDDISSYAERLEKESLIENEVIAKGYSDCVALLGEDNASVIVKSDKENLTEAEATQIIDIVTTESNVNSDVVKIIELK